MNSTVYADVNESEMCANYGQVFHLASEDKDTAGKRVSSFQRHDYISKAFFILPFHKVEETRTDLQCHLGMKKT